MTKEQRFYHKFRGNLPTGVDCCRIENSMESGMPDTNICALGVETWVEFKVYEGGRVLIRPAQNAWGHRRAAAGGRVFIVAWHPAGHICTWRFPDIVVEPGGKYLSVTQMGSTFCNGWDMVMKALALIN